jgi:hypothetical protein
VVEALAQGKKAEYVVMEDGKGRSINTTMLAVRACVCWVVGGLGVGIRR